MSSLLVFHTFLACSSISGGEFMRTKKIHYLKDTRDFDVPFSQGGCVGNIANYCCARDGCFQVRLRHG